MREQDITYDLYLFGNNFDQNGHLKPSVCPDLTQQVVERHLQKFNMGTNDLLGQNLAWVLIGYTAVFDEPIKSCIPLIGRTWHSQKKGPYYRRETAFYDLNGKRLIGISTFSVMLDMNTRSITRRYDLPGTLSECTDLSVPDAKPIIAAAEFYNPVETFTVRNSQVDALGHLNNARYTDFAYDVMTDEERAKTLRRLEITFHSELRRGDTFLLSESVYRESDILYFRGSTDGKKAFDLTLFIE
ncbi:MAG TPA: thioesterase [Oscillospiraceae bacterium]|nr:thioesterase [Oscillospiraceae bacterium]